LRWISKKMRGFTPNPMCGWHIGLQHNNSLIVLRISWELRITEKIQG
jgi:hypothetical protein